MNTYTYEKLELKILYLYKDLAILYRDRFNMLSSESAIYYKWKEIKELEKQLHKVFVSNDGL